MVFCFPPRPAPLFPSLLHFEIKTWGQLALFLLCPPSTRPSHPTHPPQHIARLGSLHWTLLPLLTPSPLFCYSAAAAAAATPSGQIRAAGIVPHTDRAPDPRRGVAALERRGPERLEPEGSSSAVVDPPAMAPVMDSSVEKVSSDPRPPRSICGPSGGCGS